MSSSPDVPSASGPRLLVTTAEAARQLSICTKPLRGLLHADVIHPVRIGQKLLVPQVALDSYVQDLVARAEPHAETSADPSGVAFSGQGIVRG